MRHQCHASDHTAAASKSKKIKTGSWVFVRGPSLTVWDRRCVSGHPSSGQNNRNTCSLLILLSGDVMCIRQEGHLIRETLWQRSTTGTSSERCPIFLNTGWELNISGRVTLNVGQVKDIAKRGFFFLITWKTTLKKANSYIYNKVTRKITDGVTSKTLFTVSQTKQYKLLFCHMCKQLVRTSVLWPQWHTHTHTHEVKCAANVNRRFTPENHQGAGCIQL